MPRFCVQLVQLNKAGSIDLVNRTLLSLPSLWQPAGGVVSVTLVILTPKVLIYAKPSSVSPNPNPLLTPLEDVENFGGLGGPMCKDKVLAVIYRGLSPTGLIH